MISEADFVSSHKRVSEEVTHGGTKIRLSKFEWWTLAGLLRPQNVLSLRSRVGGLRMQLT